MSQWRTPLPQSFQSHRYIRIRSTHRTANRKKLDTARVLKMNAHEMVTPQDSKIDGAIVLESWFEDHADQAAVFVVLVGLLARLWAASGIFLNPDEALHFRLANQASLALAYGQSATAAHPPLLILFLYYWRALGTSDLWLRLPSVIAGSIFCWVFFKWLTQVTDRLTAFIGLLFVSFLLPIIMLAAEVR